MSNSKAAALRNQINRLAADLRVAEATETKAAIRCRKLYIMALESQLSRG